MKRLLIALLVTVPLACKKTQPKAEEKKADATIAPPAMPAAHLDPRNAAATLRSAHVAADKLQGAEDKQSEQLDGIDK